MREFKFRAWNKQENEMVDLVTVGSREVDKNRSTWPALYYRKSDGIITGFDHEEYEVLQYTGLKDKNGVEIYEGDVVPITTWEETSYEWIEDVSKNYVIKFISGGFALHKDGVKPYGSWYWLHDRAHTIEVIGNIYENPELIGGDQHGKTS